MARIRLELFRGPHGPTATLVPGLAAIRLVAQTRLIVDGAARGFHHCVVDTGAALSLFPARLWSGGTVVPLGRTRIGGLVARDDCRIEVLVAEVQCVLSDGTSTIGPLTTIAYLSDSNEVPALLGIASMIELCDLHVSIRNNQAYLEH